MTTQQLPPAMQAALDRAPESAKLLFSTLLEEATVLGIQFHPSKDRIMASHPIGRVNFCSLTLADNGAIAAYIRVDTLPAEVFDHTANTHEFSVTLKHIDLGAAPLWAVYHITDEESRRQVLAVVAKILQQKHKWGQHEPVEKVVKPPARGHGRGKPSKQFRPEFDSDDAYNR